MMKPLILALALVACAGPPAPRNRVMPIIVAAGSEAPLYSCRLLYDEQKKCAFGSCDKRTVERLHNECLRDGGRP
jgi:hypothetical protein